MYIIYNLMYYNYLFNYYYLDINIILIINLVKVIIFKNEFDYLYINLY